jgi:hypothetical protein
MGGETPVKALKHARCADPPRCSKAVSLHFPYFKMAGCLSEEELEIAISLNGTSFVAVFSSCPRTILKYNFKLATKNELVNFAFRH